MKCINIVNTLLNDKVYEEIEKLKKDLKENDELTLVNFEKLYVFKKLEFPFVISVNKEIRKSIVNRENNEKIEGKRKLYYLYDVPLKLYEDLMDKKRKIEHELALTMLKDDRKNKYTELITIKKLLREYEVSYKLKKILLDYNKNKYSDLNLLIYVADKWIYLKNNAAGNDKEYVDKKLKRKAIDAIYRAFKVNLSSSDLSID